MQHGIMQRSVLRATRLGLTGLRVAVCEQLSSERLGSAIDAAAPAGKSFGQSLSA
jgi:hypothetical protein